MATRNDRRTPEQMKTHRWLVTATDRFMSGWGGASGGASKCAWACETLQEARECFERIKARDEMKYVNITNRPWYPRASHVSIYVNKEG